MNPKIKELIEKANQLPVNEKEKGNKRMVWFNVENLSITEMKTLIQRLKNHSDYEEQKFHLLFSEPIPIRRSQTKYNQPKRNLLQEANVKFFESNGSLCYTFHSRTGYYVSDFDYSKIVRIGFDHVLDKKAEKEKKIQSVLNRRFDEVTWSNLTVDNCMDFPTSVLTLKDHFPSYVHEKLKEAFEQKKEYSYHTEGTNRHWRVSTKMCDDGVFRAWFSSEYTDCANGQYYLLLNPTTAAFCEHD